MSMTKIERDAASLIRFILEVSLSVPSMFAWTVLDFSAIRLVLPGTNTRLHVFHDDIADEDPMIDPNIPHDHPVDFESYVVAGAVCQQKYKRTLEITHSMELPDPNREPEEYVRVQVNYDTYEATGNQNEVGLHPQIIERIPAGQTYGMQSFEIHRSFPEVGTITLFELAWPGTGSPDRPAPRGPALAHVYLKPGSEWRTARLRDARENEVVIACRAGLERLKEGV